MSFEPVTPLHREAVSIVVEWIAEYCGEETATTWCWQCSPLPCWLPSLENLEEGLSLALGEITIGELCDRCERERDEAMEKFNHAEQATPQRQD